MKTEMDMGMLLANIASERIAWQRQAKLQRVCARICIICAAAP